MQNTINVKVLGIGNGVGEYIKVLRREDIEKIINGLSIEDVYKMALIGHIEDIKHGYAIIKLRTGELSYQSLSNGERLHAIDDVCITLLRIDSWAELRMDDYFTIEEMDLTKSEIERYDNEETSFYDIVEEHFTEKEIRERIAEYNCNGISLDMNYIKEQLDEWYKS